MKKHSNIHQMGIRGMMLIAILLVSFASFGSISQAQATNFSVGQQVISTIDMNLRSGPAKTYPTVGVLKHAEPATVTGAPNTGWYPVDYNGLNGWVAGDNLRPYSSAPAPTAPPATPTTTGKSQPTSSPTATPVATQGGAKPGQPQPVATPKPTATPNPQVITATRRANLRSAMPVEANADGIMLGVFSGGNVRSAPTLTSTIITGWGYGRKVMIYESVTGVSVRGNNVWYVVGKPPEREQVYYVHSSLVKIIGPIMVPQPQYRLSGHWIDVNLTQQSLTAFDGQTEVMHTLISSGAFTHTTDVGYWKIYYRLDKQEMKNPDPGAGPGIPGWYDLPDVPFPEYFNPTGEAIHGTYWHDNFGTPMSHGCVNATTPAAQWIYQQFATIGTSVVVHF